jgi:hypothetical protein
MAFSQKQAEWFDNAGHRWNFKTGAVRSGKTFADFYTIPKRIRARVGKPGLAFIFGVSKSTIERNILEPMREIWGDHLVGGIKSDNTARLLVKPCTALVARRFRRWRRSGAHQSSMHMVTRLLSGTRKCLT